MGLIAVDWGAWRLKGITIWIEGQAIQHLPSLTEVLSSLRLADQPLPFIAKQFIDEAPLPQRSHL